MEKTEWHNCTNGWGVGGRAKRLKGGGGGVRREGGMKGGERGREGENDKHQKRD